jgi:hypothetical protein
LSNNHVLDRVYQNATVVLEQIKPKYTEIKVYLSSNQGQIWLPLEIAGEKLLDGNKQLYQVTYQITNLSSTVEFFNLDNTSVSQIRNQLKLRINLVTKDLSYLPVVNNLIVYT